MDEERRSPDWAVARSWLVRAVLFLVRLPLLVFGLVAVGMAFWIFSELAGDSRMYETTGIVVESESLEFGSQLSPPERSNRPCRYPRGTRGIGFSTGWFIAEHAEGTVLFCSGPLEVGTEVEMWVNPTNSWDGRLVPPTFTILQAILWLVVALLAAAGFVWAWVASGDRVRGRHDPSSRNAGG